MTIRIAGVLLGMCLFNISMSAFADELDDTQIKLEKDRPQAMLIVQRWQLAHQNKNAEELTALYADQVDYYHQMMRREKVIANKSLFFKSEKRKFLSQKIVSTISINSDGNNTDDEDGADDSLRAEFVKQVVMNDRAQNYPASLYIKKNKSGLWQIIAETDDITDSNLGTSDDSRTVIRAKFNGKQPQYAWVNSRNTETQGSCDYAQQCSCYLWSSDATVKPIEIPSCNSASLDILSGLDGSGRDRLVLLDWREMGGWTGIHLYDIQRGQWTQAMNVVSTHINQLEVQKDPLVVPEPGKPGYVRVTAVDFNTETEEQESESKVLPLIVLPE